MKKTKTTMPSIQLRQNEGFFTMAEMAESLGVAPSTVWKWADVGLVAKPTHRWRHHDRRYYTQDEYINILKFLRGEK